MEGLPKVDELDLEVGSQHDVVGLDIEMDNFVGFEVPEGHGDREEEVYFGEEGDALSPVPGELDHVAVGEELHYDQRLLVVLVLVQVHRHQVLRKQGVSAVPHLGQYPVLVEVFSVGPVLPLDSHPPLNHRSVAGLLVNQR